MDNNNMNIIQKYNLKKEILKNLDIVQKYESGWFNMEYGDESLNEGFWDISYEIVGTYDNPDQEAVYYALKKLAQEIIDWNKYSNVKLVVANNFYGAGGLTLVQQKEVEHEELRKEI